MEHNSLVRDIHHLPLLLMFVERYNVTLIIGRILISSIAKDKLAEAVQAYMGLFYLLDIDYPPSQELGLTMLHFKIRMHQWICVETLIKP